MRQKPRPYGYVVALAAFGFATPAWADDQLCPERPGQTTPPCVVAPGKFLVEIGVANWTVESNADEKTDTVELGQGLLRAGLSEGLEAQFGWTAYGFQHSRDRATGEVARVSGTGDVSLGLLYNAKGSDGPVALQAFMTLPTGGAAIGAGDWGAGLRVPVALDVGRGIQLALTPEVDAAVNESGDGRHLAFGGAAGISLPLGASLTLGADIAEFRDQDPDGHTTSSTAGLSLAFQAGKNTQFDVGGTAGLNADSPDMALYVGIAGRF